MSDIQFQPLWGDPPGSKRAQKSQMDMALDAFIALMRTAPGRWAELSSVDEDGGHPGSRASIIKKRYPDCDVQTRAIAGSKRRRIWVRVRVNVPDVIAANGDREQARRERAAESIG